MALSALKTFIAGEILYASDLNSLNTNILNNALALTPPLRGSRDAGSFDITALDELAFTDAAANPTASGRLRRNGGRMVWAYEDARTNSVVEAFAIQATTTGTPAAGIGTRLVLRGGSADENPSDLLGLDAIATDVTAASEDTVLGISLRVAGAALTEVWRLQATGAFLATVTHANTVARTYTFPDRAATLEDTYMQVLKS